jgi:hypothetical protein
MQPTVEADLQAVRLGLERLAADDDMPATAVEGLAEAGRSLRRLERSWARVLPYLVAENTSTAALLDELAPLLPEDLRQEIATLGPPPEPVPDLSAFDAMKANELNGVLRALVARAINALPPSGDSAAAARARVTGHLRSTLELRPW